MRYYYYTVIMMNSIMKKSCVGIHKFLHQMEKMNFNVMCFFIYIYII